MKDDLVIIKNQKPSTIGWFFGESDSPWGRLLWAENQEAIWGLGVFEKKVLEKKFWQALEHRLNISPRIDVCSERAKELIAVIQKKTALKKPIGLNGTGFEIAVWDALLKIPFGALSTYSVIAQSAGFPRAIRAVGTAIGKNPIGVFVPCHRVIRKDGSLGGYAGGLSIKKQLLALEGVEV